MKSSSSAVYAKEQRRKFTMNLKDSNSKSQEIDESLNRSNRANSTNNRILESLDSISEEEGGISQNADGQSEAESIFRHGSSIGAYKTYH